MLKSMTGYGAAVVKQGGYEINAEVRSLNSKFADIQIRLPAQLTHLELPLRKRIAGVLERGKISLTVELKAEPQSGTALLNEELLKLYYRKFHELATGLGEQGAALFALALQAPGVLEPDEEQVPEELAGWVEQAVEESLQKCDEFRKQEGRELAGKIAGYLAGIGSLLEQVAPLEPQRLERIEEKLRSGLAALEGKTETDPNRFEQELIYYIEKLDISEEKVRLRNHLDYFAEVMKDPGPAGKKLGFIAQEMGREINTLGSKANDAALQRLVVEMKEELEKIKEQILNVL